MFEVIFYFGLLWLGFETGSHTAKVQVMHDIQAHKICQNHGGAIFNSWYSSRIVCQDGKTIEF